MNKKLTAIMSAAALCLTALPLPAAAADTPELPGWVPQDYVAAVDFYNEHGKCYTSNGYICFLTYQDFRDNTHKLSAQSADMTPVASFVPQLVIDAKEDEVAEPIQPSYEFTVTVYHPEQPGDYSIDLTSAVVSDTDDGLALLHTYTFSVDEAGKITETDIYGWLPDSRGEYETFCDNNPPMFVKDNYLVYCGNVNGSYMFTHYYDQLGEGKVELEMSPSLTTLYADSQMMPTGNSIPFIHLYRPTKPGTLRFTVSQMCLWQKEEEARRLNSDCGYFSIDEALNITQVSENVFGEKRIGDCDGDGENSVLDLVHLHKYLHGSSTLNKPELADLDGDGTVDIFDYALLRHSLLIQSPWKDGDLEVVYDTAEELHLDLRDKAEKNGYMRITSDFKDMQLQSSWWDGEKRVNLPLTNISEDTFKDHRVLIVTAPATGSNVKYVLDRVERCGSQLVVHLRRKLPETVTPDMAYTRFLIAVKNEDFDGVTNLRLSVKNELQGDTVTPEIPIDDPIVIDDPVKPDPNDPIVIDDPTEPVAAE